MLILFIIVVLISALFLLFFIVGVYRTISLQSSQQNKTFLSGEVPDRLPDGFYRGSASGYVGPWKGKVFNKHDKTGMNIFDVAGKEIQKFPFVSSIKNGLQDKTKDVIAINYNVQKNSFLLRRIDDEIVEVEKDKYLGKVHIRILPNLVFTVAFFTLEKG